MSGDEVSRQELLEEGKHEGATRVRWNVEAATNKALAVTASFNGQTEEKNGGKAWKNNEYSAAVTGATKAKAIKDMKMSGEVYIPEAVLKKKNAKADVWIWYDLLDKKGNYIGAVSGKIGLTAVNENGKIKLYAWDNEKNKSVKASAYATCKKGKGAYKKYYIVKFKNIPIGAKVDMANGKQQTIKKSTKYAFNMGVGICVQGYKNNKCTYYIDNLKTTSGKTTLAAVDFTKKPKFYAVYNYDKEISAKKYKIVKF